MYKRNEHENCQIGISFDLNGTTANKFYPLEVGGRGSETQLQVGENQNTITFSATWTRHEINIGLTFGDYYAVS